MMTKKVEFILAYNPGGQSPSRQGRHGILARTGSCLLTVQLHTHRKQEDQVGGEEKLQTLKAQPR